MNLFSRKPQAFRGKPVHMAGWLADLDNFPAGFEQLAFGHAHEDGVQSAGLQPSVSADVVTVLPSSRIVEKYIQHLKSLR